MTTLPPEPEDSPEIEWVRRWTQLELRASQLGVAAARFEVARADFVSHAREHGFVDEDNRARGPHNPRPSRRRPSVKP